VRSLYYWWRDEAKAVEAPPSPCFWNIIDALEVGFGDGILVDAAAFLQLLSSAAPILGDVGECLSAPVAEPILPPPGFRAVP
jgi:hypothetical protein